MATSTGVFSFNPTEYAAVLTEQTHSTLSYLLHTGYLTTEQFDRLENQLVVTAIPQNPGFGRRLLARFFSQEPKHSDTWVFPIVEVPSWYNNSVEPTPNGTSTKGKPTLEVVK